jgi:hypothetical protein
LSFFTLFDQIQIPMKKNRNLSFLFAFLACSAFSCGKDTDPPGPDCSGPAKTFSGDVNPIIQTFCNQPGCHQPGSINGPGQLTNYTEVFNARASIRVQIEAGLMPQTGTLTTAQRNAILCWIDNGAPNN